MISQILPYLLILFSFGLFGQNENEILIRICEESDCEFGTPSGYINSKGDTIVPIGKYHYCYTDTIVNYGIVLEKDGKCLALDSRGKFLYEVKWYDNGPDYISDGYFRIIKNGKIGFADETGEIVIEPQFECSTPFENGKAKVSFKCELIETSENIEMKSNSWFYIDKNGNKIK